MSVVEEPIVRSEVTPAVRNGASAPAVAVDRPAKRSKTRFFLVVLLVVAVIGAIAATMLAVHASRFEETDDAYIDGHVITISPQVSALVKAVHIDDNSSVHKGDILVELDPTDYQVALDQASATQASVAGKLQQAQSEINSAIASRDEAQAEVDVARANAKNAEADYQRFTDLSARSAGAVSKQQMDSAIAAEQSNTAQVKQADAKLAAAEAEIATKKATAVAAEGDLKKAIADVHKAEVNKGYCTITASEDGKITRKNVEPGSYVQTGEQLFALVPSNVWVVANFKETQLNKMRKGQAVTITVDAFPGHEIQGKVDSIQSGTGARFSVLPAENATGNFVKVVQRVPVKILLQDMNQDQDDLLTPGMSVQPEVDVR